MKKLLLTICFAFIATFAMGQNNYQDVVYLKNGSIVRGIIIGQVTNESLKIATADGSLFVFNISDVEKITKERPINQTPVRQTQNLTTDNITNDMEYIRSNVETTTTTTTTSRERGPAGTWVGGVDFGWYMETTSFETRAMGYYYLTDEMALGTGFGFWMSTTDMSTMPVYAGFRIDFGLYLDLGFSATILGDATGFGYYLEFGIKIDNFSLGLFVDEKELSTSNIDFAITDVGLRGCWYF